MTSSGMGLTAALRTGQASSGRTRRSILNMAAASLLVVVALTVLPVACSEFSLQSLFARSLVPASVELSAGESVEFTVEGGVPPYEFQVDEQAGVDAFEVVAEDSVKFSLGDPLNVPHDTWNVTVTDAYGKTATSTIYRVE